MKRAIYLAIIVHFARKLLHIVALSPGTKFDLIPPEVYPDEYIAMLVYNPSSPRYRITGQLCTAIFYCTKMDPYTMDRIGRAVQKILDKATVEFRNVSYARKKRLCTIGTVDTLQLIQAELTGTPRQRTDLLKLIHRAIRDTIKCSGFELA